MQTDKELHAYSLKFGKSFNQQLKWITIVMHHYNYIIKQSSKTYNIFSIRVSTNITSIVPRRPSLEDIANTYFSRKTSKQAR